MTISWTTIYGLNWTATIPAAGTKVEHGGLWQPCNLGESFNLNDSGQWVSTTTNPYADKASLNVGSNGYKHPTGVHIMVGVQDPATGDWAPATL